MLSHRPETRHIPGWTWAQIGTSANEIKERAGTALQYPVLSVTKHRGILPASEYFKKPVHGKELSAYKVVRRGQLAYATIHLEEGSVGILRDLEAGLVSPMYTVLEVSGQMNPEYLLSVLKTSTSLAVFGGLRQGTVNRRASISFGTLSQMFVHLPPLLEQCKIVTILAALDETIEKTEAVLSEIKAVRRHLSLKLLTTGLFGTGSQGWNGSQLGALLNSSPDNGLYLPQAAYGRGTPIVRINDFSNGEDLAGQVLQRVELPSENEKKFRLKSNDILINRVNSLSHLAKAAYVRETAEPTIFESNMMRIRVDDNLAYPRFVFHVLSSTLAADHFRRRAKKAVAQASVNQTDVKELPVLLPPYKEQIEISEVIDSVQDCLRREIGVLGNLRDLRPILATALLTGQIRVTPDEDPS